MTAIDHALGVLEDVQQTDGLTHTAVCPVHGDDGRRIKITPDEKLQPIYFCAGGCRPGLVAEEVYHRLQQDSRTWQEAGATKNGQEPPTRKATVRRPDEEPPPAEPPEAAKPPKLLAKVLSFERLLTQPAPVAQIDDLFYSRSLVEVFGAPNHGKTFIVMDIAFCLRMAVEHWCGRAVRKPGAVFYVNADGGPGFGDRARAWHSMHRGLKAPYEFYTLPDAVSLYRPAEMLEFRHMLSWLDQPPAIVVFDTYSRCIAGMNENQQEQASLVVQQLDRIRMDIGSTCLLLHHTDKTGTNSRGSSVILGACDTQIRVEKRGENELVMTCEKQRDGRHFSPLFFKLERVPGTNQVWPMQQAVGPVPAPSTQGEKRENVERVLAEIAADPGITRGELETKLSLKESTLRNYLKPFIDDGSVVEVVRMKRQHDPDGYRPPKGLFINVRDRREGT